MWDKENNVWGNKMGEWNREDYCKVQLSSLHVSSAAPS